MLRLKKSFKVAINDNTIFVMSEMINHSFPLEYKDVLSKLQQEKYEISIDDIEKIEHLNRLNLLTDKDNTDALINYFEMHDVTGEQIDNQRSHLGVAIINLANNKTFATDLTKNLVAEKFKVSTTGGFKIYLVDTFSDIKEIQYPAIVIKVGSCHCYFSHLLTSVTSFESFKKFMLSSKSFFENESFQIGLPKHLIDLQSSLIRHEVINFLIDPAADEKSNKIINWNLLSMEKQSWEI
jgi:hypothetical protein